jgi:hypothetical protein
MSDKIDGTTAGQVESMLRNGGNSSVADFVANLLPKDNDNSKPNTTNQSQESVANQLPRAEKEQSTKDGMKKDSYDLLEQLHNKLRDVQRVGADETGIIDLKTGDKLVRVKGQEILVMPDGGALIVKPDGSYDLSTKGNSSVKHDAKSGTTTIDMGKNGTITMKDGRITEVYRHGQTVEMSAPKEQLKPQWDNLPHPYNGSGSWNFREKMDKQGLPNVEIDKRGMSESELNKLKGK